MRFVQTKKKKSNSIQRFKNIKHYYLENTNFYDKNLDIKEVLLLS